MIYLSELEYHLLFVNLFALVPKVLIVTFMRVCVSISSMKLMLRCKVVKQLEEEKAQTIKSELLGWLPSHIQLVNIHLSSVISCWFPCSTYVLGQVTKWLLCCSMLMRWEFNISGSIAEASWGCSSLTWTVNRGMCVEWRNMNTYCS